MLGPTLGPALALLLGALGAILPAGAAQARTDIYLANGCSDTMTATVLHTDVDGGFVDPQYVQIRPGEEAGPYPTNDETFYIYAYDRARTWRGESYFREPGASTDIPYLSRTLDTADEEHRVSLTCDSSHGQDYLRQGRVKSECAREIQIVWHYRDEDGGWTTSDWITVPPGALVTMPQAISFDVFYHARVGAPGAEATGKVWDGRDRFRRVGDKRLGLRAFEITGDGRLNLSC